MSETSFIQMRRVGNPATCHGVKDVFRLRKDRSVIGRNSMAVDFYINSSLHPRLISREHAIISLTRAENQMELTLHDKSLNGTFVNDAKIQGSVHLAIGDTVTFGHLQGIKIKAYEIAGQENSEFRFKIEKVDNSSDETWDAFSPPSQRPLTACNDFLCKTHPGEIRKPRSSFVREVVMKFEGNNCHNKNEKENNGSPRLTQSKSLPPSRVPCITSDPGGDVKDQIDQILQRAERNDQDEVTTNGRREDGTFNSGRKGGSFSCEGVTSGRQPSSPASYVLPKQLILGVPACRAQADPCQKSAIPERNVGLSSEVMAGTSVASGSTESNRDGGVSPPESEEDIFASIPKVKMQPGDIDEDWASQKRPSVASGSSSSPPQTSGKSTMDASKWHTKVHNTRGKSVPLTGFKSVSSKSNAAVSARKRHSDGALPSAKRTMTEVCAAVECRMPTGEMIPWVQCDDCDQWFHTSCAGCNYEEVCKSSSAFKCGCL